MKQACKELILKKDCNEDNRSTMKAAKVELNDRGQIVIPSAFRKRLGLEKKSRLQITMKDSGVMELQKLVEIPVDYTLHNDPELLADVTRAYESFEKRQIVSIDAVKNELFGENQ